MTDLRLEARHHNELLTQRLDQLVPRLLDEAGVDCWVLIGREYAEDPVLMTMLPAEWLSARRRTILVLTRSERFAVARYPVGSMFAGAWDPETQPDQWAALVSELERLDPGTIAIGTSETHAHADGLTATEHEAFMSALPDALAARVVSGGLLGVRWLETRLPKERAVLEEATRIAHDILRRGLSREAVTPGTTTTEDLVWWYRQTVHDAGLRSWFQPSVSIQRADDDQSELIGHGDLIHVDFGIVYRSMCTDQQEHAYVLEPSESAAPVALIDGLRRANHVQDLLMARFVEGHSGNMILAGALADAAGEGLDTTIYTHSIGLHGHGAGMTIGLWDQQDGVPGAGDHPLHRDTAYSIELMAVSTVPEWDDKPVRFMLEQDAWFDGSSCTWLDGRQESLWLI